MSSDDSPTVPRGLPRYFITSPGNSFVSNLTASTSASQSKSAAATSLPGAVTVTAFDLPVQSPATTAVSTTGTAEDGFVLDGVEYSKFNLPKSVATSKAGPVKPKGPISVVWKFFRELSKPTIQGKTHVCLLCLSDAKEEGTLSSWEGSAACTIGNPSNGTHHMVSIHKEHPYSVDEIERQLARNVAKAKGIDMEVKARRNAVQQGGGIVASLQASSDAAASQAIMRYFIYEGLPFNQSTSPWFHNMIKVCRPSKDFSLPAADTHNDQIDTEYHIFCELVKSELEAELLAFKGMKFLNLVHDVWTTPSQRSVLGGSVVYINREWEYLHIPVLATNLTEGHSAKIVSDVLKEGIKQDYGINIEDMVRFVPSDTTPSATNVANDFDDVEQVNCEMHVLSLCIGYAVGLKENTKNRAVVTVGGEFSEGKTAILKLQALMKAAQRKEKELSMIQSAMNLPQMKALIDVTTRIAYTIVMIRRGVLLYRSMLLLKDQANAGNEFVTAFNNMQEHWVTVCEIEAVCQYIAGLALNEVQREHPSASYVLVFRKQIVKSLQGTFKVMNHLAPIRGKTREFNFPRQEIKLDKLSKHGQTCQARLLGQVEKRFPEATPELWMSSLLDPRVNDLMDLLFKSPDGRDVYPECVQCLKVEHRKFYNAFMGIQAIPGNPSNSK